MRNQNGDLKLSRAEIASAFADPHWAGLYPPVLSVEQTARLLQVPRTPLYDWSSRGLLRGCSRRVGKYLSIYRDRLLLKVFNEGINSHAK